ncbi:MAG: LptF/LptG family permease [Chlamydiales bacterium]|nr:LptF/LptG family permease [Chlamydiales bacterium]
MPILWRYLLKIFFKNFFLTISLFVLLMLVVRSQDIARFATLGTSLYCIILFTVYQIPNMLPICIPIAALISSCFLMQKICYSQEMTSLRSCQMSIHHILFPIYFSAVLLSLVNFIIVSELTPRSRSASKVMLSQIIYQNPLLLLKKNRLMKTKDSYIQMDMIQSGKSAHDVILSFYDDYSSSLNLIVGKKLMLENNNRLGGDFITFITYSPAAKEGFNHLLIDNQNHISTDGKLFQLLTSNLTKKTSISEFSSSQLLGELFAKNIHKSHSKAMIEIIKRLSLSLSIVSFSLLGLHLSMQVGRERSKRSLIVLLLLVTFSFICFLGGRSFHSNVGISILLYVIPHILNFYITLQRHHFISKGAIS